MRVDGFDDVVTAFLNEPLSNLLFLHSFVESEDKVLETTANVVMSKDDYYRLLKPEVVTKIPGEELFWITFVLIDISFILWYYENREEDMLCQILE